MRGLVGRLLVFKKMYSFFEASLGPNALPDGAQPGALRALVVASLLPLAPLALLATLVPLVITGSWLRGGCG